jgi:hypothetical protein
MTTLRPVQPNERAPRRKKALGIVQSATRGGYSDMLTALQLRLSVACEDVNTPARDLAALSRRLIEVSRELETLKAGDEGHDPIAAAARTPEEPWGASLS